LEDAYVTLEFLIAALLWTPPSILLHTTIHEGSHALVAVAKGARITGFNVLPFRENERFYMGRVTFDRSFDEGQMRSISMAPFWAESIWLIGSSIGLRHAKADWLKAILVVEVVASLVDLTAWALSSRWEGGDLYPHRHLMPSRNGFLFVIPVGAILACAVSGVGE
jgi:hypothetical protein